jgi:hypothetical protein
MEKGFSTEDAMPSAKPPQAKEPATAQSARQMLDELDVLMDRMLAIPVNELDDAAPSAPAIVRMPTVSATLTVLEAPVEDEESPAPERREPLRESFVSYSALSETMPGETKPLPLLIKPPTFQPSQESPAPEHGNSAPEPDPIPEEVIPPSITAITALPAPTFTPNHTEEPVPLPGPSLASRCLLPLVWFNQAFDKSTLILGGTGRWLRGPRGRYLLGLMGLVLLLMAGLWLVKDWLGWTW